MPLSPKDILDDTGAAAGSPRSRGESPCGPAGKRGSGGQHERWAPKRGVMSRGLLGRRGRGSAELAALDRAAARLTALRLYPGTLDTTKVRILHVPWLFRLPWFRRFRGYNMAHLILLRRPVHEVSDDLVTHELCHVWQDQDHRARMWLSYVVQGYAGNRHEIEARAAVADTRVRPERPAARGPR
jgi:hypothetical protein